MTSSFGDNRTMLRVSLLLPGVSTLLLMAVAPGLLVHSSTYAAIIALVIVTGAVVWITWRHAQPVATLRQELYDIGHPATGGTGSSWQRWVAAGDRSDARGRALALFALSVAITAVIFYGWFA
jgi:hypothetical protein